MSHENDYAQGRNVLALDIGGTKLAAAVVGDDGSILAADRDATPQDSDAEFIFYSLEQLARRVLDDARTSLSAVGVGCGGPMSYSQGRVSPLNIPAWRDFPLRDRLQESFSLPCSVDNDAKALVLGERWLGAARGNDNVLGIVVSTGVGGGAVVNGVLLHGASGNAGHIGHIVVRPDGPPCACGARGCVEALASGVGLRNRADAERAGETTQLHLGSSAAAIAEAARAGDPLACRLYREAGEALGRGIAAAASLLDVSQVVAGGSIALNAWDLLAPSLVGQVERDARLEFTREIKIEQAGLGPDSGLIGAAALALGLS